MNKEEVRNKLETELRLQGKSNHTIKMYLFYNQGLLSYIKKPSHRITYDNIKQYLEYLTISKRYNASSISLARSALAFLYEDIMGKIHVKKIKIPKRERKLPTVLTKNEILRILQAANSQRNRLIIELMYSCGLRVSECTKLKIEDLDLDDKSGVIRQGKGKKDRIIFLSDTVIENIKSYLKLQNYAKGYLFQNKKQQAFSTRAIQKIIKKLAKKAEIAKEIHSHMFRHAFGTHLVENGVDITRVQMMMGHSSLDTTRLYVTLSKKALKDIKNPLDSIYEGNR